MARTEGDARAAADKAKADAAAVAKADQSTVTRAGSGRVTDEERDRAHRAASAGYNAEVTDPADPNNVDAGAAMRSRTMADAQDPRRTSTRTLQQLAEGEGNTVVNRPFGSEARSVDPATGRDVSGVDINRQREAERKAEEDNGNAAAAAKGGKRPA